MHLNDTHSHLDPSITVLDVDGSTVCLEMGGIARIARKIRSVRKASEHTLLLHAGDAVQGTLYFTRYQGEADFAMLNLLDIDAMAIGNHEFDKGPAGLARYLDLAAFPIISANIDTSMDSLLRGRIAPWVICRIENEPVGIIGLTTPETANISRPGPAITFCDPSAAAERAVKELESLGINKIIALTVVARADKDLLHIRMPGRHPSGRDLEDGSMIAPLSF